MNYHPEGQKSGATPTGERSGRQRPLAGRPASWPASGDDRREDPLPNCGTVAEWFRLCEKERTGTS